MSMQKLLWAFLMVVACYVNVYSQSVAQDKGNNRTEPIALSQYFFNTEEAESVKRDISVCSSESEKLFSHYNHLLMWTDEGEESLWANDNGGHSAALYSLFSTCQCQMTPIDPPTVEFGPRYPLNKGKGRENTDFHLSSSKALLTLDGRKLYVTWEYMINDQGPKKGTDQYLKWKDATGRSLNFSEKHENEYYYRGWTSEIYEIINGRPVLKKVTSDFRLPTIGRIPDIPDLDFIFYIGTDIVLLNVFLEGQMQIIDTLSDKIFKSNIRGTLRQFDGRYLLLHTRINKQRTAIVFDLKKRSELGRTVIPNEADNINLKINENENEIQYELDGEQKTLLLSDSDSIKIISN